MTAIKPIVIMAMMIAMVGLVMMTTVAAVSGPVALLAAGDEPTSDDQITLKLNTLTTASKYIYMQANIPLGVVGNLETKFDLVLDFEGAEFASDIIVSRTTVAYTSMGSMSSTWRNNYKVKNKKNQIKIESLDWPEFDRTASRSIVFRAKITNVGADGFKIKNSSTLTSRGKADDKITFAEVTSPMATPFATLKLTIKSEKQEDVFDRIKAPIEFALTDISLPSPIGKVQARLHDLLGNAVFTGPADGKCTLNDKPIKTSWTQLNGFIFEVEDWGLLAMANVKCEKTKFDLEKDKDLLGNKLLHVWVVDFVDDNNITYQSEALTGGDSVENGSNGFPSFILYLVIAIIAIAVLVGIVFALYAAKIGPFKPKEAGQFTTGLVGDDNQYQTFH